MGTETVVASDMEHDGEGTKAETKVRTAENRIPLWIEFRDVENGDPNTDDEEYEDEVVHTTGPSDGELRLAARDASPEEFERLMRFDYSVTVGFWVTNAVQVREDLRPLMRRHKEFASVENWLKTHCRDELLQTWSELDDKNTVGAFRTACVRVLSRSRLGPKDKFKRYVDWYADARPRP